MKMQKTEVGEDFEVVVARAQLRGTAAEDTILLQTTVSLTNMITRA